MTSHVCFRTFSTRALMRALLATIALAFAIALITAGSASAAFTYVNDESGANDYPGQKDLTRHGVDPAGLPASLQVTWNWDEINWSGGNTGDACVLFDSDADGKVNYAFCTIVGGAPATLSGTVLYSCSDNKVDRCTSPNFPMPITSSTCSVSTTNTDPFPTGAGYPQDTTALCNIVLSDIGAPNLTLVNTCSYPSGSPNSAPADCVLIPRDGFLIISKVATPNNAGAQFNFTLDSGATPVFTANGSQTSGIIPVRSDILHSLAESMPALWSLNSASCSNGSGTFAGSTLSGISVGADATVTCTFNNSFAKASPTISTQASSSVAIGGSVFDTATLASGYNPTGTITFNLYGPNDATCAGPAVYTTNVAVTGNGAYVAPSYVPTAAGTYRWIASYGGDANNNPVSGACNDANESVLVTQSATSISTVASTTVEVGGDITDTATLSGGNAPTGLITFNLYGPDDATCANAPVFSTTETVTGNGDYTSDAYTAVAAGTYRWIASYGGDANNSATSGACNDANESVVVSKASPTISTNASTTVEVGGDITDTATLAGSYNATGDITFNLYGPDDATCSDAPVFTTTETVTGDGDYTSDPYTATAAGTYRWVASYAGDGNNNAVSGACNDANESVVVSKASPTISTNASATVEVGGDITDTATLTGSYNATGDITFNLYGPDDATCSNAPVFTTTESVNGDGDYTSDAYTATTAGTYRWVASYAGDGNNNAVSGACNDANESVVVSKASPTISTNASAAVEVGGDITDTATIAGSYNATGDITFNLYGPDDATCSNAPIFTTTELANGDGDYTSDAYTATTAGTYRWVASYAGDANNNAVSGACNDANESVVVRKVDPSITTLASAGVEVGGDITDTATLTGGYNATGDITFNLYGPDDATCSNAPVFTTTEPVNGDGDYTSNAYTATAAGTYRWVASYAGDVNNDPASGACNDPFESVVVRQAAPSITTLASAPITIGGTINDTATLSGGYNPTGTITFNLYGPDDATCANAPVFTTNETVAGNGDYTSDDFTPTTAGTYRWIATYNGDANNATVTGACNDPFESVDVRKESPSISTNASATVEVGGDITDTATLTGGYNATGDITFNLYGPDDATCSNAPVFTTSETVNGDGDYTSDAYTATAAGTYRWVASYAGDANNNAVGGACNDANESVVVSKASPTISTNASATVEVGGDITDTATLTGGYNATGDITFNLYGPDDATCSNAPVFTTTESVNGDGDYTSDAYTATTAGTYRWVASYAGDGNNNAVSGACNDANESVVVSKADPTIVTNASATVEVGNDITDTATLAGSYNATGDITFNLYGPDDATCSNAPVFTTTESVNGDGDYTSDPYTATTAGTYRWVASYAGDVNNTAVSGACNDANESVVVSKASPSISTQASNAVGVGGNVNDTATLSGGYNPTGTITFNLYGPDDATCANAPVFTTTETVNGNGAYPSDPYTATAAGTYRWVASYSGDVNNVAVSGACNDPNESVAVRQAAPSITTQASATVTIGGSVSDTATLSGGFNPTGTITFNLYGPDDATCANPAVFTSVVPVNGNGAYPSASFAPATAGTYRWIATYSGDANNATSTGACNDPNESVIVQKDTPAISTVASATVEVGGDITDTATLSGGTAPTGSITFNLYGPDDATCSNAPVFTTNETVNGNGDYTSDAFTATTAGTYRWVASYGGDVNNEPATGACNDANESVVVSKAAPTISTNASATVEVGNDITDTATLAGGYNATGDITFNLYGPDDATCSNAPVFTTTETVNGNGDYTSDPFTATAAGTYRWVASYGGDVNNDAVSGACNDANESVVVSKADPTIATNASATVEVGNDITDTATLAGSYNATGDITFNLYGPDDATCSNAPVFTATEAVNGDGDYTSNPYTATTAGTYRWVASYAGDSNNLAVSGACNDANESVVVSKATPTISTQASPTVLVGNDIYDTATLAGGYNPTGTITFTAYAPGDTTCTAAIYTTTETVNGNGVYTADSYTANVAGEYRWIASYGGDVNNDPVSGACNDANESVVVTKMSPTISTIATPTIDVGQSIADTATLAGGFNPTGTITFNLYAPGDTNCTTSVFTDTVNVNGNGDYTSGSFSPTVTGEFRWIASYSGDVNNDPVSGACGDKGESSVVTQPSVELTKSASATSVAPGTQVTFTLTVTNTGDIDLLNVDLTDNQCSPLTYVSGDFAPIDVLDVGESWVFNCTKTITANTVNVATVGATSPNQTTVTDTATATVNVVNQPPVEQLGLPTVRLASQSTCKSRRFRVTPRISGGTPTTSVLRIDGRRKGTSRSSKPSFVIDSRKYSVGRHRYTITITFTTGQQVVASGRFSRCATTKARVSPKFTG